jgi:hypothetical protein
MKLTTAHFTGLRNPHPCLDIMVYSGSQKRGNHAVIVDDLPEDFDPKLFLEQLCTGEPPAELTIRELVLEFGGGNLESVTTAAIWCSTDLNDAPEAGAWIEHNPTTGHYKVLGFLPNNAKGEC